MPQLQGSLDEDTKGRFAAYNRGVHNTSSTVVRGQPLTWPELHALEPIAAKQAEALAQMYGYSLSS